MSVESVFNFTPPICQEMMETFLTEGEESWINGDVALQEDVENSMYGLNEQCGRLKKGGNKIDTCD